MMNILYGKVEIDLYPIPPLMTMTGPINWVLAQAKNKAHAKHLAAMLILGQPFNASPFQRKTK